MSSSRLPAEAGSANSERLKPDSGLIYEISYNARITGNTFARNGLVSGPRSRGFPTGAIYLSESGADPRVGGPFNRVFQVTGNKFVDNKCDKSNPNGLCH